jgi:cytochrome c oxidase assembly protein subunit 15
VILLASVVASFGWIMVASGLVDKPWVNPYKLTLHLSLALILFCYVLWLALNRLAPTRSVQTSHQTVKILTFFTAMLVMQVALGGMMSGMKAGLLYPTFPTMKGEWIPAVIGDLSTWTLASFANYDSQPFAIAFVQFFHRLIGFLVLFLGIYLAFKGSKNAPTYLFGKAAFWLPVTLSIQILLGITTLMFSIGQIPVLWGVLHQGWALVVLSNVLILWHQRPKTTAQVLST